VKGDLGHHGGEVVHGEAENVVVFDFDFLSDFVPDHEVGLEDVPFPP